MKKIQKFALLFLSIGVVTLVSFGDDDSNDTPAKVPATNTEKITEKNFIVSDFLITIDSDTAFTFSDLEPCTKDDFIRFEKDGTVVDDQDDTKCDPADSQTESFLWSFLTNETELQLNFGMGDVVVYDILTHDLTTLKRNINEMEHFTFDGNDITVTTTTTFTAQ